MVELGRCLNTALYLTNCRAKFNVKLAVEIRSPTIYSDGT